jgi:lipopolysaccharide cholinephosphotransferase
MRKFLANIISWLIPFKRARHKVRRFLREWGQLARIEHKIDYLTELLKATTDITKLPNSVGKIRIMQDCSLCVLNHFAVIAKKNDIEWWLDWGTLLGYHRCNGFIPWDDDIDIAMLRSDYERLFEILDKDFCKDGFFYRGGEIIQLFFENTPAQVDIWPIDFGYSEIPPIGKEKDDFLLKVKNIKDEVFRHFDANKLVAQQQPIPQNIIDSSHQKRDTELTKNKQKNGFLFYGVETFDTVHVIDIHDDVFPLKSANFLGIKTHIPNNTEIYLINRYGWDFMNFPPSLKARHTFALDRLTTKNYKRCQSLIYDYSPQKSKKF